MKAKIIACRKSSWWYSELIGKTVVILLGSDGKPRITKIMGEDNYSVHMEDDPHNTGRISICELEILPEVVPEPRLYRHAGKDYALPVWAKFVTCDKEGKCLFCWEEKPEQGYYEGANQGAGFGRAGGKRDYLREYTKPLPVGAFITAV